MRTTLTIPTLTMLMALSACTKDDEPNDTGSPPTTEPTAHTGTDTGDSFTDTGDTPTGTGDTGDTDDTATTPDGTIVWLHGGGGVGEEWIGAVDQLPGGPIIAVAQTQSLATWWTDSEEGLDLVAEGDNDGLVLFVDPDGGDIEQVWGVGGSGSVQVEDVATADERIAVLVGFDGQVVYDNEELAPDGAKGRVLLMLDGGGALVWSRRIDADWVPGFWGEVDFTPTGDVLVGLGTVGDVVVDPGGQGLTATGQGATDATAVLFAADGTAEWVRLLGNSSEQFQGNTLPLADGGFVQTGGFAGTLSVGAKAPIEVTASVGDHDVFVARFSREGEPIWVTTFGSGAADAGQALVEATDGSIWVSGQFAYGGGGDLQVDGQVVLDGWAASLESDGFAARLDPDTGEVSTVVGLSTSLSDIPMLLAGVDGQVALFGQIVPSVAPGDPNGSWSDDEPIATEGPSSFWAVVDADGAFLERSVSSQSAILDATWVDGELVFGGWFVTGSSFGAEGISPTSQSGSLDALLARERVTP